MDARAARAYRVSQAEFHDRDVRGWGSERSGVLVVAAAESVGVAQVAVIPSAARDLQFGLARLGAESRTAQSGPLASCYSARLFRPASVSRSEHPAPRP